MAAQPTEGANPTLGGRGSPPPPLRGPPPPLRREGPENRWPARLLLALVYVPFGVFHMLKPESFLPIMPGWVPFPREVIIFTGACEVAGGLGLLVPSLRWWAGVGLAAYAVAVFPANLHHAVDHVRVPGLPSSLWYHVPRLLFQPVFVWWALWAGSVIDWPFRRARRFR